MFGLLLFMGLITWLVVPLLTDIHDNSRQTREQHLPEIVNNQRLALKIEKISGYLNTIYWSQHARQERNSRLQAQVLIQSFMLEQVPYLATATVKSLETIRLLINLRNLQRERMAQVASLSAALPLPASLPAGSPRTRLQRDITAFRLRLSSLALNEVRWDQLAADLSALRRQLQDAARGLPAPAAEPLARRQQTLDEVALRLQEMSALNRQAERLLHDGREQLEQVANYLTTDAALQVQQLNGDIGTNARAVAGYTYALIGVMAVMSLLLFRALQHFMLRPVEASVAGLRAIERGGDSQVRLPPVLFSELNTICRAVEDYSALTRDLRKVNDALHRLSQQDGLTGLANRRCFDESLLQELVRVRRHRSPLALLMLDIDYFKQLNDRLGHVSGDECLKALAAVLSRLSQRPGELAARYGGEEFVLILPGCSPEQCLQLAERIRAAVAALCLPAANGERNAEIRFTVSIGVAWTDGGEPPSPDDFIQRTDRALYQAKLAGRNRVRAEWEPATAANASVQARPVAIEAPWRRVL
ncbi:hypothetical protein C7H85_07575 [Zobellella endophytica]|uniref:diguanylate cyclase n=1 Tax=Zobellella endophytica TaxID=2116700 RepID=A0A2P7R8E6_9GAMM|nr:hypothetical protein C7H85_07575 [Zobellella endophytica]